MDRIPNAMAKYENIARSEAGRVHGPTWLTWLGHLRDRPAVGLEIGTFEGDSAEWMCENIFTHPDSRYHCVDPFTGSVEHHIAAKAGNFPTDITKLEQTAREKLARFPNVTIHKGYSQEVLPRLISTGIRFDSIYIDGDHSSRSAMRDGVMAFELLNVRGIMFFDDYEWNVMPDKLDCPKDGIDGFLTAYGKQVGLVPPLGWQRACWKMAE